jgi:hypothetical protein
MANLPPGVAARAGGVAVATTTTTAVATAAAAHGRWGAAVAGRTAEATTAAVGALRSTSPAASAAAKTAAAAAHATNIASGSAATAATASTTSAAATAAEARALTSDGLKELRDFLVGLLQQVEEVTNDSAVAAVEESSGNTSVSCTSGTTDTMDVVVNIGREVVVDHVSDIWDTFKILALIARGKDRENLLETTGSDSSGNKDRAASSTEHLQSLLTLALSTVTVNGCGRESLVDQEVGERVGHTLGLDEDQR